MLLPKRRLSDHAANAANMVEHGFATRLDLGADKIPHLLGQRAAHLKVYEFIGKTNPKDDQIDSDDLLAFLDSEIKKHREVAYSEVFGVEFPHDKQLAFGKILTYKSTQTNTLNLIKELTDKEGQGDT